VTKGTPLDGPEVQAQRVAIEETCAASGLELVDFISEHFATASESNQRTALLRTFERFESGEASCLIVRDLESLSDRVDELASIVDRLEKQRVRLIALDVGLDTATPTGQLAVARRGAEPEPEPEPTEDVALEPPAPEPEPAAAPAVKAFGYASVQRGAEDATAELEAQRRVVEQKCKDAGVDLVEFRRDREPKDGKALDRPSLSYLLGGIAAGEASCIVVAGLERLSRSVAELGALVRWFEQNGVRLIAVELDLDTATPSGRMTARALASIGGWERERVSERTRQGLAAARAKRHTAASSGERDWVALRKRIADMRASGMTLQAIADVLNGEGVPTQRGGAKWRPSSVQTAAGYKRRTRRTAIDDLPPIKPPPPAESGQPGSDP
jgi:DNA invertase Pin-like site-specific DNA recombinase